MRKKAVGSRNVRPMMTGGVHDSLKALIGQIKQTDILSQPEGRRGFDWLVAYAAAWESEGATQKREAMAKAKRERISSEKGPRNGICVRIEDGRPILFFSEGAQRALVQCFTWKDGHNQATRAYMLSLPIMEREAAQVQVDQYNGQMGAGEPTYKLTTRIPYCA